MSRRRWISILTLPVLILVAGLFLASCSSSPSTESTGIANQIYISQLSNTVLQVIAPNKSVSQPIKGDLVDFQTGSALSTAETGTGYVQLGFPGQVPVYIASGTEMVIKEPPDEQTKIDVLLKGGSLLIQLPVSFPVEQRFVVESPEGARVWISGPMMGVQYDPATHELYADCLKDHCGYFDAAGSHPLAQGYHVSLNGTQVLDVGPGTRNELWQYIPNMVSAPTAIPSATPNLAGTQACRYFTSLGLSCAGGFPTLTITPSPTPNFQATQACRHSQNLGTPCP